MTTTDDEVRKARVAELQRRRAVGSGSKIAVTGIGFTAMLGMVAAMGYANRTSASVPVSTTPSQVVVVIHPTEGDGQSSSSVPAASGAPTTNAPVTLTAQPTVRQAPATNAPSGRTNGSR